MREVNKVDETLIGENNDTGTTKYLYYVVALLHW